MLIIRTVKLALKSLMLHKLRSGLTMLGIVFGVFSVIAMLAIGEGASAQAQQQVLQLGATNVICISVKPPQESSSTGASNSGFMLRYGLKRDDFKLLMGIPNVVRGIPIREIPREVRFRHRSLNSRLVGCTADYLEVNHLEMAQGRFLSEQDTATLKNVAVVASETAETLFPIENPIGQQIQLGNIKFVVVGVTKNRTASAAVGGSLSGQDFNKDVYIPLATFRARIGDQIVQRGSGSFSAETVQLNQITLRVRERKDVIPTAEAVRESLQRNHKDKKDVSVVVPLELLKQADQLRTIFNVVLGSIAAISLVVGGIGIMNIMLATVTERTREIGVRRALGARQADITRQFLTETVVLAGSGGLIGVGLGLLTPVVFKVVQWGIKGQLLESSNDSSELGRIFSGMTPNIVWWSPVLAFVISVGIGIVFGLYPARAAAKLDPIEALRHE